MPSPPLSTSLQQDTASRLINEAAAEGLAREQAGLVATAPSTSVVPPAALAAGKSQIGEPLVEVSTVRLPDWPPVLTFFLLAWLVMAWSAAIILYLATFPEKVAWFDRAMSRWWPRDGSHKPSARQRSCSPFEYSNPAPAPSIRRFSSNADFRGSAIATGLGISFGDHEHLSRLRRRRSWDEEALRPRAVPDRGRKILSTAPIPSLRRFLARSPQHYFRGRGDDRQEGFENNGKIERSGQYERGTIADGGSDNGFGWGVRGDADDRAGGMAGVLGSVNVVIEFAAKKLAKVSSDPVRGRAESGLLLPFSGNKREL